MVIWALTARVARRAIQHGWAQAAKEAKEDEARSAPIEKRTAVDWKAHHDVWKGSLIVAAPSAVLLLLWIVLLRLMEWPSSHVAWAAFGAMMFLTCMGVVFNLTMGVVLLRMAALHRWREAPGVLQAQVSLSALVILWPLAGLCLWGVLWPF